MAVSELQKYNFSTNTNPVFLCIKQTAFENIVGYKDPFSYPADGLFGYRLPPSGKSNVIIATHVLEARLALEKSAFKKLGIDKATYLNRFIGQPNWTDDYPDAITVTEQFPTATSDINVQKDFVTFSHLPEKNIWYQELERACKGLANPGQDTGFSYEFAYTPDPCIKWPTLFDNSIIKFQLIVHDYTNDRICNSIQMPSFNLATDKNARPTAMLQGPTLKALTINYRRSPVQLKLAARHSAVGSDNSALNGATFILTDATGVNRAFGHGFFRVNSVGVPDKLFGVAEFVDDRGFLDEQSLTLLTSDLTCALSHGVDPLNGQDIFTNSAVTVTFQRSFTIGSSSLGGSYLFGMGAQSNFLLPTSTTIPAMLPQSDFIFDFSASIPPATTFANPSLPPDATVRIVAGNPLDKTDRMSVFSEVVTEDSSGRFSFGPTEQDSLPPNDTGPQFTLSTKCTGVVVGGGGGGIIPVGTGNLGNVGLTIAPIPKFTTCVASGGIVNIAVSNRNTTPIRVDSITASFSIAGITMNSNPASFTIGATQSTAVPLRISWNVQHPILVAGITPISVVIFVSVFISDLQGKKLGTLTVQQVIPFNEGCPSTPPIGTGGGGGGGGGIIPPPDNGTRTASVYCTPTALVTCERSPITFFYTVINGMSSSFILNPPPVTFSGTGASSINVVSATPDTPVTIAAHSSFTFQMTAVFDFEKAAKDVKNSNGESIGTLTATVGSGSLVTSVDIDIQEGCNTSENTTPFTTGLSYYVQSSVLIRTLFTQNPGQDTEPYEEQIAPHPPNRPELNRIPDGVFFSYTFFNPFPDVSFTINFDASNVILCDPSGQDRTDNFYLISAGGTGKIVLGPGCGDTGGTSCPSVNFVYGIVTNPDPDLSVIQMNAINVFGTPSKFPDKDHVMMTPLTNAEAPGHAGQLPPMTPVAFTSLGGLNSGEVIDPGAFEIIYESGYYESNDFIIESSGASPDTSSAGTKMSSAHELNFVASYAVKNTSTTDDFVLDYLSPLLTITAGAGSIDEAASFSLNPAGSLPVKLQPGEIRIVNFDVTDDSGLFRTPQKLELDVRSAAGQFFTHGTNTTTSDVVFTNVILSPGDFTIATGQPPPPFDFTLDLVVTPSSSTALIRSSDAFYIDFDVFATIKNKSSTDDLQINSIIIDFVETTPISGMRITNQFTITPPNFSTLPAVPPNSTSDPIQFRATTNDTSLGDKPFTITINGSATCVDTVNQASVTRNAQTPPTYTRNGSTSINELDVYLTSISPVAPASPVLSQGNFPNHSTSSTFPFNTTWTTNTQRYAATFNFVNRSTRQATVNSISVSDSNPHSGANGGPVVSFNGPPGTFNVTVPNQSSVSQTFAFDYVFKYVSSDTAGQDAIQSAGWSEDPFVFQYIPHAVWGNGSFSGAAISSGGAFDLSITANLNFNNPPPPPPPPPP